MALDKELLILVINIAIKYGPAAYAAVVDLLKKDTYTVDDLIALKSSFVLYKDL